ncbi:cell wall metabolism sensor histidine kinase WalK [Micrococcus sp. FDAARGOS_333]|uniref:sensor histidine kinase n=1 Tax=Micrococcus sp. FDAARGOS_333 TaxID=1930558 RepID=UPI000B4E5C01|nr:HAMP domain-containing sensor histidine kinase [Micrococcus sp. FDAARGOS_333]PNL17360.1 sensor histidine kinase [Micrococcus sp. FDAARGOS_333]
MTGLSAARGPGIRPWASLRYTWKNSSLRSKLIVLITALMLLTVALTALFTATLFRNELVRQLDEDLQSNRDNVSIYLTSVGQSGGYYTPPHSILRFYGELWDNEGNQLVSTPVAADMDGPRLDALTEQQVTQRGSEAFEVPGSTENSDGWRVRLYRLRSGEGTVAVALPLRTVTSSVERVTTLVVTIGLISTAGAVILANMGVRRAFRPLNRVERTASMIAAGDLSQRVENAPPDTEVGRLSRSLNAMLAHIESAFRDKEQSESTMRRFVQDASHELRTPLVTIRGFSELYRHGGITKEEDVAAAMGRIESEATRMHQLVEDLLTLARLDEQRALESQPLDLQMLAMDAVLDAKVNAPDREVTMVGLDGGRATSATVYGDEGRIRQVVVNLMTNALRYTPAGTPIEIAVGTVDVLPGSTDASGRQVKGARDSVIEIRDHGHGVSEEEANRIFERFYRADSSRHRETGGTGLGLAIVAAIVAQHDGSVRLRETEGGGATFSVHLPWSYVEDAFDDEDDDFEPDEVLEQDDPSSTGDRTA